MPDIFLSYNREDQARAKLFAEAFESQGLSVWWDVGLKTGEAYDKVTEDALRKAKAVVVLWSKKSVESRWVRAEATLADRNNTLVPCMIEPCERPIMFELTQTAELAHWAGDASDRAWLGFVADVKQFLQRSRGAPPAIGASAPVTLREIIAEPPRPPETLLAVLPFDNLSSDAEMQFFSDGVSEDILSRIQRGSKLKVIGRTSSFQFRGADKPKAASALKATHLVDGSIRRAGAKVRIAAHLTEAATQTTLWSDRYDRSLEDIFAVQDEISEAIAEALNTAFFPQNAARIDPAVYDLFLKARDYEPEPEALAASIAALESVTRLAPGFAEAWGRLGANRGFASQHVPFSERPAIYARVREELERCTQLDPFNNYAPHIEAHLCDPFGAFLAQQKSAESLLARGGTDAVNLGAYAWYLEMVGRTKEAVGLARAGRDLDPKDHMAQANYAQSLWRAGRFAEGRAALESVLQTWPDHHHTAAMLIIACMHQRDWDAVDRLIDPAHLARYPLREHGAVLGLVFALRDPGPESRQALLNMVRGPIEASGHAEPAIFVWIAHLGFVDEAYALLDKVRLGPSGGPEDAMGVNAYRTHLLFQVAFPELRDDPRFVKLCARLGLVEYWLATEKWPDCADAVPYDFRKQCEAYRDYPKDTFWT